MLVLLFIRYKIGIYNHRETTLVSKNNPCTNINTFENCFWLLIELFFYRALKMAANPYDES